uniref:Uncharacterized protein n=1 Tax=Picea glauca TaxID=3330 RepID=A0A124GMU5_PICGL|nr:hypothetical protein ABT39_MTgene1444 [Picea glauca]
MPFLFLSLPFFFIQRERNEDARLTVGRSRKQHFESKVLTLPNKERYNYILYYDRFWIEERNNKYSGDDLKMSQRLPCLSYYCFSFRGEAPDWGAKIRLPHP